MHSQCSASDSSQCWNSRIWGITCLFNPAGFAVRPVNYRRFRKHFSLPLTTVELAFDMPFVLDATDAEILIQIRNGDCMWQKERLLNIGLQALPRECDQVIWIDADMICSDATWPSAISRALETHPILQPFSVVRQLAQDAVGGPYVGSNIS